MEKVKAPQERERGEVMWGQKKQDAERKVTGVRRQVAEKQGQKQKGEELKMWWKAAERKVKRRYGGGRGGGGGVEEAGNKVR